MSVQIKLRRDTAANWVSINPVLASGEPGLETDTLKIKYGDGSSTWNSLPYPTVTFPTSIAAASLASNVAGGAANQILYQTQAGTTGFITAPTQIGFLQWTGSGYSWSTGGYAAAAQITGTTLAPNVITTSITTLGSGVTATTFTGLITANGGVTGNVTGNLTGNVTGNVTGTAGSAAKLTTATTINGVSFDGSAPITITAVATSAPANSLTGTTLASNVVSSSLTSVGTLTGLTVGTSGLTIASPNQGSSYASGNALQVAGGVGISGSAFINGNLTVTGNITDSAGNVIVQSGNISASGTITAGSLNVKTYAIAVAVALG